MSLLMEAAGTPRIRLVALSGDGRARGLAAGIALGPGIRALLADWLTSLTQSGVGDGEAHARDLLRDTDFRTALRTHCPDLLDEVVGMAEGAKIDPDLLFALQLMDEEWAYRGRHRAEAPSREKCSSVAIVTPGGPTWIGQNMDLGPYTDGHQVVLRIAPDGERSGALVFTAEGMVALLGVNAAGVGVCVNSLPQLPNGRTGVPVAFMIRKLLQARGVNEAADWVRSLPHATNQHYLLAEAGEVRSFECSAAGVTEYRPPDPARVFHTNHPLSEETGAPETAEARQNSVRRLLSLTTRLARGEPDLEAIRAALSACDDPRHPVSREYKPDAGLIGFTTGSMISELNGGSSPIESWVSPGPPSREGYARLELDPDPPALRSGDRSSASDEHR